MRHSLFIPRLASTVLISAVLISPSLFAKGKSSGLPPLPGEIRSASGGVQIHLESGRRVQWPEQGPLVLRDAQGAVLATVSLQASADQESGAEAMGLSVEERDLGGTVSGKKKYLSGKKAPSGRKLASDSLGEVPAEQGQTQQAVVDGIAITTLTFSNGSSLWKIDWPGRQEELYFDKRKSLIHSQQSRKQGPYAVQLKQFADGSYQRRYQRASGELQVTYDAEDQSHRIGFLNGQGEILRELNCAETCE